MNNAGKACVVVYGMRAADRPCQVKVAHPAYHPSFATGRFATWPSYLSAEKIFADEASELKNR